MFWQEFPLEISNNWSIKQNIEKILAQIVDYLQMTEDPSGYKQAFLSAVWMMVYFMSKRLFLIEKVQWMVSWHFELPINYLHSDIGNTLNWPCDYFLLFCTPCTHKTCDWTKYGTKILGILKILRPFNVEHSANDALSAFIASNSSLKSISVLYT